MIRPVLPIMAALTLAFASGIPARAAEPAVHVRGTIVAATAHAVDVRTSTGVVHLAFDAKKTMLAGITPTTRAAIVPNAFVGIATDGDAPGARAREVVVFPEAARGMGEGHYGWDLPGARNMMTNGTVAAPKASMMTNGTVKKRAGGSGPLMLNVTYTGGASTIVVPGNVPIVTLGAASPADLKAGAHVTIFAGTTGGKPTRADVILVGKNGLVPPM